MASAVPYAKANLLAILDAATTVSTTWSYPGQYITDEAIFMGDAEGTETASIHQVSHRENFIIPVWVIVTQQGDDAQPLEERAWQIVAQLEDAIRANPSLNNAQGVTSAVVTGKTPESYGTDGARAISIVIDVTVNSRF